MGGIVSSKKDATVVPEEAEFHFVPGKINVPYSTRHPSRAGYHTKWLLGEGSFGIARMAWLDNDSKQPYVIKEVNVDNLLPQHKGSWNNEAEILSQLWHPNIVILHEVFSVGKMKYLVMEYLAGGELFDAICTHDFFSEDDARRMLINMVDALHYCHFHGIVHRDLKPENFCLTNDSKHSAVKLIDFGAAIYIGDCVRQENLTTVNYCSTDSTNTAATAKLQPSLPCDLHGTISYAAPEMLCGEQYDTKADMWSLGVLLYIMLSGLMPYENDTRNELSAEITSRKLTFPSKYFSSVSSHAKNLVENLLCVDPSKRYSTTDVYSHPFMKDVLQNSIHLDHLRKWNAERKLRVSSKAIQAVVRFNSLRMTSSKSSQGKSFRAESMRGGMISMTHLVSQQRLRVSESIAET